MKSKFLVPFDTARQLKEKGYPQKGATMYYDTFSGGEISLITDRECVSCVVEGNVRHPLFKRLSELYIAAPTYHEVVDWLEGRKVRIYAEYCNGWWYGFIDNSETMEIEATVRYQTREEALNDGILKALEML